MSEIVSKMRVVLYLTDLLKDSDTEFAVGVKENGGRQFIDSPNNNQCNTTLKDKIEAADDGNVRDKCHSDKRKSPEIKHIW